MPPDKGEVMAVGIGLVWGMITGGRGGGGMWDGFWPLPWAASNCWFGAPAGAWAAGMEDGVEAGTFSAIVYWLGQVWGYRGVKCGEIE